MTTTTRKNKGKDPPRSIRVPDAEWITWKRLGQYCDRSVTMLIREQMRKLCRKKLGD